MPLNVPTGLPPLTSFGMGCNRPRFPKGRHHHKLHLLLAEKGAQEHAELKGPMFEEFCELLSIFRGERLAVRLDVERFKVGNEGVAL